MVIANPIYNVVFKRMMENERVAKFFIGTLLDENIEAVEVKPQEFIKALGGLELFRLAFFATIKTESGELKKILIKIQKAANQMDLMRFIRYLNYQYQNDDTVDNPKVILPVITIYILRFKLPEVNSLYLKVECNYKGFVNNRTINTKSDFIKKLNHNSVIVQVERITSKYQTRLDKLLSVFQQSNFVDNNTIIKQFNHEPDIKEVKIITDILHYAGTDPEEKERIEIEQEAGRSVNADSLISKLLHFSLNLTNENFDRTNTRELR